MPIPRHVSSIFIEEKNTSVFLEFFFEIYAYYEYVLYVVAFGGDSVTETLINL